MTHLHHRLSEQMFYGIETSLRCFAKFCLNYLFDNFEHDWQDLGGLAVETFPLIVTKFRKYRCRV